MSDSSSPARPAARKPARKAARKKIARRATVAQPGHDEPSSVVNVARQLRAGPIRCWASRGPRPMRRGARRARCWSSPSSGPRSRRPASPEGHARGGGAVAERGGRGHQPQGPGAARPGRERQDRPALRGHPAARLGAGAQRPDLVRDALHPLLQSGSWRTLERLGVGRFAVQAGREREFANIYRGSDLARRLDDDEFAAVLAFVKAAFDLALTFHDQSAPAAPRRKK